MSKFVSVNCPSLQILDKTQTQLFPISGFLVKCIINYCYNTGTSNDIAMKLAPETKLGKKNTTTFKTFDDDIVSTNYDAIVIFPFYD